MQGFLSAPLHGTHPEIAKFEGKFDPGYMMVSGVLRNWIQRLEADMRAIQNGNPTQCASTLTRYG